MSTQKVNCAFTEMVAIDLIKPHPKNFNRHPAKQLKMLAKVIQVHGWRSPIVVSSRSGFVVAGHGRLEAAKLLKLTQVPVDYQKFASEAEEVAHMVADNKLPELSEMDMQALNELIKVDVIGAGLDIELTGFDQKAYDSITVSGYTRRAKGEKPAADKGGKATEYAVTVVCIDEAHQKTLAERLRAEGLTCKELKI